MFFSAEIPTGPAHGVSVWGGHRWEDWMIDIVPLIYINIPPIFLMPVIL